jgi:hypothetical protein
MRLIAAASTEKTSTRPIGHCPTAVYGDYRSIVVRALAARSPDLRTERPSKLPRCASSSDTVFLRDASAPECLAGRPYCLGSTVDSDPSEGVDSTRRKSPSMLDIGVGL